MRRVRTHPLSVKYINLVNAAARLVFRLRRYDHVTDGLAILHWLRLPERFNFKLALMAYRVLNGMAPSYLNQLVPVSSLPGRRRLRSSFTSQLLVPPYRLSTVGRTFTHSSDIRGTLKVFKVTCAGPRLFWKKIIAGNSLGYPCE